MKPVADKIKELFYACNNKAITHIEQLPQSGSDRIYFRLFCNEETFIATYNLNIKENKTFISFSHHFKQKNLPVPKILCSNDEGTIYLQQDLGNISLLNKLEQNGYTDDVLNLYKKSLEQLARLQVTGNNGLDYNVCLTAKEFGRQAIFSDLLYFKYYFLDTLQLPYDKQAMLDDFDALSAYLTQTQNKYFMFRDFQSRNILVDKEDVYFIDFQGGMKGALQYDVASLLWQAKAQLSDEWKSMLLGHYIDAVNSLLPTPVNAQIFTGEYNGYVLIRLLQVLGAYGFRGLFERKAHFLTSIPLALKNLEKFLNTSEVGTAIPELRRMLIAITNREIVQRFEPLQATAQTPLVVTINSFSYKQFLPADESGNGGGFVFDCRGILNPGRFAEFKTLTGKDKMVMDFLDQHTLMNEFLNGVFSVVNISVEDYIKRDFTSLMINFGCTGGQHRSVYAAEQTARHLKNKYKVKVNVQHINQVNWLQKTINPKPGTAI